MIGSGAPFAALSFLVVIGPLIFLHELGHYFAGRMFGIQADIFSIGFGREIFGRTDRRGTRWKLGWIPMGGYVKFAGDMNPASQPSPEWLALPPEQRARTFQAKPVWQRFIVVAAGPVTNFVVAIAIVSGFVAAYGVPVTPPVILGVQAGSPADKAGLHPGDRITRVSGRSVDTFDDVSQFIRLRPNEVIDLDYRRGQVQHSTDLVPAAVEEVDTFGNRARIGRAGLYGGYRAFAPVSAWRVVPEATIVTFDMLRAMIDVIGQIIVGERSVKELGGPLKIAQVSGQRAQLGVLPLIDLMAMISINLGFINLLPIPMLDGGHLLLYLVEGARRRPLPPAAQEWAFRSGLALLLMFMLFVTANDLGSFGLWQRLAGLIG